METRKTVRLARTFCSARDRNVPVLRRERVGEASRSRRAAASDPAELPELVSCLDYGVRCTGWLCPLFELPTLPPDDLLAEAVEAERRRKRKTVSEGRAILERAREERALEQDGERP